MKKKKRVRKKKRLNESSRALLPVVRLIGRGTIVQHNERHAIVATELSYYHSVSASHMIKTARWCHFFFSRPRVRI